MRQPLSSAENLTFGSFLVAHFPPGLHILSVDQLEAVSSTLYDYIVVGGGAGGIALASALAEDKALQILLLERGASREKYPETHLSLLHIEIGWDENEKLIITFSRIRSLFGNNGVKFLFQPGRSRDLLTVSTFVNLQLPISPLENLFAALFWRIVACAKPGTAFFLSADNVWLVRPAQDKGTRVSTVHQRSMVCQRQCKCSTQI